MAGDFRQPPRFSYPNPLNAVPTKAAPLRPPSVPVRTRPGVPPTAGQPPVRRKRPAARPTLDPLLVALTRMLLMRHLGA